MDASRLNVCAQGNQPANSSRPRPPLDRALDRLGPLLVPFRWAKAASSRLAHALQRANPWWLLVAICFLLSTWGLTNGRYPVGHDLPGHLLASFDWAEQIRQGVWYPRWIERSSGGLGSPLFHFYGPLGMYSVLLFSLGLHLPGTVSLLASFWLAMLVSALGVARLVSAVLPRHPRWLPSLIAALSLLSPYFLLDVYVRNALGETWAMALLPWLLAALLRSLDKPSRKASLLLLVATSAFALCHPPLLLLAFTGVWLSLLLTVRSWSDLARLLRAGCLPMLAGLALDSFYLVSAVHDQHHVQIDALNAHDALAANRLLVTELSRLSPKPATGFDGSLIPIFVLSCVVLLSAAFLLRRRSHSLQASEREHVSLLVGLAAVALFMQTDLARGIYTVLPLFNRIQFAYRWMAVATVANLGLWAAVIFLSRQGPRRETVLWRIPIGLLTLWMAVQAFDCIIPMVDWNKPYADGLDAMLGRLGPLGREPDFSAVPLKDCRGNLCVNNKDELLIGDAPEYRPLTQPETGFPPRTFAQVEWSEGDGQVTVAEWKAGRRRFVVDSSTGGELLARTYAWLGWEIAVNGTKTVGDRAGDSGRMLVKVPPGHSEVRITYRGTPAQRAGELVSILCIALLSAYAGWCAVRTRFRGRRKMSSGDHDRGRVCDYDLPLLSQDQG